MNQRIGDVTSATVGGRETVDLSTDRSEEPDYKLIRLDGTIATVLIERSDSRATLHFGEKVGPGFDTFEYDRVSVPGDVNQLWVENESGEGDLVLVLSRGLGPELAREAREVKSENGTETGTGNSFAQSSLDGTDQRIVHFNWIQGTGSLRTKDASGTVVWEMTIAAANLPLGLEPAIPIPVGGSFEVDGNGNNLGEYSVGYKHR